MPKTWTMTRLESSTVQSLETIRIAMQRAAERGQRDLPLNHQDHLSLNAVVQRLIEDYFAHRQRSTEAAKRRDARLLTPMPIEHQEQDESSTRDTMS